MMAVYDTGRGLRREGSAPLSIVHFLGWREFSRLFLEHDWNTVANRKRQAIGFAHELSLPFAVDQRPLAYRANKDIKQARVHGYVSI